MDLNCVSDIAGLKSNVRMALRELEVKDSSYIEILSPVARRSLCEQFLNSNQYVAKHFLHISNGQLFGEPLPSIDADWKERVLDDETRRRIMRLVPS